MVNVLLFLVALASPVAVVVVLVWRCFDAGQLLVSIALGCLLLSGVLNDFIILCLCHFSLAF